MNIFCDTNIIVEYLEKRLQFQAVERILQLPTDKCKLYLSEGSFYTITFLVDRQLRRLEIYNPERLEQERKILSRILDTFDIAHAEKNGLLQGVASESFKDLEDSYQYQAALNCGADVLLTINIKDFQEEASSKVKILTPQDFISELENK